MSNLGLGVMLGMLSGNEESAETFREAIGKTITDLELESEELVFTFSDGSRMKLFDDGQSCCEERYMHTDDDLAYYIGSKLLSAETRNAPDENAEWDVHEVQFLLVTTDKGVFTMASHNIHNGYYGGFLIRVAALPSIKET
jgi:hypothetical protein